MSEKVVHESGNFTNIEQVFHKDEMGFAVYENGSFTFRKHIGNVLPKTKVPWPLPPMPIEYESDSELLAEVRDVFVKYVDMSLDYNYDVCAAWAMATWRAEAFNSVSYLEALGPPGSGKSRVLETLQALSYRAVHTSHLTFSSIFRAIDKDHVTLLVDQAEKLASVRGAEDSLSILDGGYRRGATKLLYDEKTNDYRSFDIFGFKAIASTKPLERSLEDRCIPFLMQRNKHELPTWVKRDNEEFVILRGKLLSYRFKLTAEEDEDNEENEHRCMLQLQKQTKDSRLRELFYPLVYANSARAEFKRFIGTGKEAPQTNGIDVLGWDFAFELNELAKQQAAQANVDVRFLRIPREVLDKRAVEQGDVRFFELASLGVGVKTSGKKATVTINDFVIPADDVPADVQKEIKHWSQWIDYWSVDWNNKNDTFHNEWQEYRTREKPKLVTESSKTYDEKGEYRVVVKVVDILGNDTTKMLQVKV